MRSKAGRGALAIGLFALCAFLSMHAFSAQSQMTATGSTDRDTYADKIRETYNFRFGKDTLSAPGNAAVEGNTFIQPGAFPKATY
nr:hypothetical protein [Acidobacteriota bacterium]